MVVPNTYVQSTHMTVPMTTSNLIQTCVSRLTDYDDIGDVCSDTSMRLAFDSEVRRAVILNTFTNF